MNVSNLVLKPTFICNFSCPYCSERRQLHKSLKKDEQLTISDYTRIIEESRLFFDEITISGAEPLFYKEFQALVEIVNSYSWNNSYLMTNGSLLKRYKDIISKFTYVQISFSDYNENTFSLNRGITNRNIFSLVKNSIIEYNKIKVNLTVNCIVLTRERLLSLDKILMMSSLLGFDDVNLQILEGNFGINSNIKITLKDITYFYKNVFPKINNRIIVNKFPNIIEYIDKVVNNIWYYLICSEYKKQCNILGNLAIILPNGDVHGCNIIEYSHEHILGNIKSKSLKDLLSNVTKSKLCSHCPMELH